MLSFLTIIGLFLFLNKFKRNVNNIKTYFSLKKKNKFAIKKLKEKRFYLSFVGLGTFVSMDFIKEYLESKGIKKFDVINNDNIEEIFQNYCLFYPEIKKRQKMDNIVDIKGIQYRIRNNPYYDILVRTLNIRNVQTSNSQSFPYKTIETSKDANGNVTTKTVTKYENLKAIHNEPTPFVDEFNVVIFETKFAPQLNFYTNSKKNNDVINLENQLFSKIYRLHDATDRIALNSFFTIKAQEDFVDWIKLKGYYHVFNKINNYIFMDLSEIDEVVQFKNNLFLSNLILPKKSTSELISININKNFDSIKKQLRDFISKYINKFSETALMPLLSPAISREAFRDDNENYLVAESLELFQESQNLKDNDNNEISIKKITSKFCNKSFVSFLKKEAKKPMWMSLINKTQIKKSESPIYLLEFKLHSFWSEEKIDLVPVVGVHVGAKIIPVNYEQFHKMDENKSIVFLSKKTNFKTKILIGMLDEVEDSYFADIKENTFFIENNVWTNNPTQLMEDENIKNELHTLVSKFHRISASLSSDNNQSKNLNKQLKSWGNSSLLLDHDGVYFIHNSKIKTQFLNEIEKLLEKFSELNLI